MKRMRCRAAVGMLVISSAAASTAPAAAPTDEEQYFLEIVNRMRSNPQRELSYMANINPGVPPTWGTPMSDDADIADALDFFNVDAAELVRQWSELVPAPALAWSSELNEAAQYHNGRMIFHDDQQHEFAGEPGLVERIEARGYENWQTLGENIYAYSENIEYGHAGFAIDWGFGPGGIQSPAGHRESIVNPDFREVGIAVTRETDPDTDVGPILITQDFGAEFGTVFATGVLYDDTVKRDSFYTPGEGRGGETVTAYLAGTGTVLATTTTSSSGGYKLNLNPGVYDIALGGPSNFPDVLYRNVVMGSDNVKLDSLTTWINDTDGSWHDPANWYGGVPNGERTVASLYDAATARRTISVITPVSVGTINLENAAGYTIAGPGVISLEVGFNRTARVNVIGGGSHEIAAAVNLPQSAEISIDAAGTLTLSGPLAMTGGVFVRTGAGVLNITGPQAHAANATMVMRGGTTNIGSDTGTAAAPNVEIVTDFAGTVNLDSSQHLRAISVSQQARVNVTSGGDKVLYIKGPGAAPVTISQATIDLNDNDMIVQSTAAHREAVLASIIDHIKSARNATAGRWQGNGITSSAALDDPLTTLAVMLNPGLATFGGELVDENAILVKYTNNGDANLDGRINADDYFRIDSGFLAQPLSPTYAQGDFNYDGKVNADDYFLIDSAFLGQTGVLGGTMLTAAVAVPEPITPILSLAAGTLLLRRRR